MFLAQADHDAGLGRNVRTILPRAIEQLERAPISAAGTGHAVEARNGFDVVIQDVWPGVEDGVQRCLDALEVGDEHFDPAAGYTRAGLCNRVSEDRRAAVPVSYTHLRAHE